MCPAPAFYSEDTVLEIAIIERRSLASIQERMAAQQRGEDFRRAACKALGIDAERDKDFTIAKSG